MAIISQGFSGRGSAGDKNLPPGQYVTNDFPVLSAGPTPHVPLDKWEFTIDEGGKVSLRWDWNSFRKLPSETFTVERMRIVDRILLSEVMTKLPEGYRQAIMLHDIQGLQHKEIAEARGKSVGTSKSQLHKGRAMLRELIAGPSQSVASTV